jgi:hypothetical protein
MVREFSNMKTLPNRQVHKFSETGRIRACPSCAIASRPPRISWDGGNMGQPNFEPHIPTELHRSMIEFPMMYVNNAFQQLLMNFFSE